MTPAEQPSAPPHRSEGSEPTVAVRRVLNWLNLSTPMGLLIARTTGSTIHRGPRGLWLVDQYRPTFPYAGAFTVGNVLIARGAWAERQTADPGLLPHEEGHTWQWAALGPFFLPSYALSMVWSLLRCGDRSSANWFEVRAGLALGGYTERPKRSPREIVQALTRRST